MHGCRGSRKYSQPSNSGRSPKRNSRRWPFSTSTTSRAPPSSRRRNWRQNRRCAPPALSSTIGFPVVMKIVSPQILHKTEAGGVIVGVKSVEQAREAYATIVGNARKYDSKADIHGVQVQQMLGGGTEVIIGAVTDPAFGKLVAFGLGGILVEVLKDITFRLAPATNEEALSMLDGIAAAEILRGVRGAKPVDRGALSAMIERVSSLI